MRVIAFAPNSSAEHFDMIFPATGHRIGLVA